MTLPPIIRLLRPQQWIKNGFVAAPLFFTPSAMDLPHIALVIAGMACFCLLSSAVYILNDWADREADRHHPTKRFRPLAAGTVSVRAALGLCVGFAVVGIGGGALLNTGFAFIAVLYFATNLGYSFGLKKFSIIDVMLVALGFVLRIYAGSALIDTSPTVWILVCAGLLALFIALAKRRDDLVQAMDSGHRASLRGYTPAFVDACLTIVLGALVVSYLIYTTDRAVMERLGTDDLFLSTPFVIAGVLRYLQITLVEERSGSPTTLVVSDPFLVGCVTAWVTVVGLLLYT